MDDQFLRDYSKKMQEIAPDLSPRESDWDLIAQKLPNKQNRRKPLVIFWFIPLILAVLIFIGTKLHNSIDFDISINKCQEKTGSIVTIPVSKNFIRPSMDNKLSKESLLNQKNLKEDQLIQKTMGSISRPERLENSYHIISTIGNPSINGEDNDRQKINESHEKAPTIKPFNIVPISTLPINLINLPISIPNLKLELFDNIPKSKTKPIYFARFSFGKQFERNLIVYSNTNYPNTIYENIISAKNGHLLDASFHMQPNAKWRFGVGLQYSSMSFETLHKTSIKSDELIYYSKGANEIKRYSYAYNIFDGVVVSRVNLALFEVSPNQTIKHSDTFDISMKLFRNVMNFRIPITFERRLYHVKDFSIFGKLGASVSLFSIIKNKLDHQTETCKELCFISGFEPEFQSTKASNLKLSSILGFNLEYKINPMLSIGLNPELIFHPNSNFSSWRHQQAIGAYLSYNFNQTIK